MSIELEAVNEIASINEVEDKENLSLESLVFLVNQERVNSLEEKLRKEFSELQERNGKVKYLHQTIQAINTATDSKGNLDLSDSPEILEMIRVAKEKHGVELPVGKKKFTPQERDRLIDNIRMTCDDLNVQNDMQLQTITRYNNERQESFQLARSILKTLHDDKIHKAQSMGR